jgi:hypothetical protein
MASYRGGRGLTPGHMGFVVDKVALGLVFSEYFGFSYQCSFHRLLYIHHLIAGAGRIGQLVADVRNERSLTPLQELSEIKTFLSSSVVQPLCEQFCNYY